MLNKLHMFIFVICAYIVSECLFGDRYCTCIPSHMYASINHALTCTVLGHSKHTVTQMFAMLLECTSIPKMRVLTCSI